MSENSKLPAKAAINLDFLRASIGFGGAWLFWQIAVSGFELFLYMAACWTLVGGFCTYQAFWKLYQKIRSDRLRKAFKAKGVDPKADPTATDDVLRERGLLK